MDSVSSQQREQIVYELLKEQRSASHRDIAEHLGITEVAAYDWMRAHCDYWEREPNMQYVLREGVVRLVADFCLSFRERLPGWSELSVEGLFAC